MSTAVLDPATVIAGAIRELVDSVRELVGPDTDDPGVLDELSRLLSRARRRINKASKTEELPAEVKPSAPPAATPTPPSVAARQPVPAAAPVVAPSAQPARPAAVQPMAVVPARPATVTLTIPCKDETTERSVSASPRQAPARPRWLRRPEIVAPIVAVLLACLLFAALALFGSTTATLEPAKTSTGYCAQVGDNNCDGMIVPSESGWACVPLAGGPLVCPPGHDPDNKDTASPSPTMGKP